MAEALGRRKDHGDIIISPQDLVYSGGLGRFGYVKGSAEARIEQPWENLTGDPYFSDGLRAVFFFANEVGSIDQLETVDWTFPIPN